MTQQEDQGEPQVERAMGKAAGLVQLYGLYRLFAAMVLPIVGAVMWIGAVIIIGHDALVLLIGIPLFAVAFVLAFRGWRRAMRANRRARESGAIPGHEGVGLIALSIIFTLAGFAVPMYIQNMS